MLKIQISQQHNCNDGFMWDLARSKLDFFAMGNVARHWPCGGKRFSGPHNKAQERCAWNFLMTIRFTVASVAKLHFGLASAGGLQCDPLRPGKISFCCCFLFFAGAPKASASRISRGCGQPHTK